MPRTGAAAPRFFNRSLRECARSSTDVSVHVHEWMSVTVIGRVSTQDCGNA